MKGYNISKIAAIIRADFDLQGPDTIIAHLETDSRKVFNPAHALFFALATPVRNGHAFLNDAYKKGIRNFVVNKKEIVTLPGDVNVLRTNDTLVALQQLASWHRQQFSIPVIGVTGSNGKTSVKEWLYQLLNTDFHIARSPKSFNSQIGVPLSIWTINDTHTLALFEAGISQPGEMVKLEEIIRPTIGILTNIGEAHSEGFSSLQQKLKEKCKLFKSSQTIIYCSDILTEHILVPEDLFPPGTMQFTWSKKSADALLGISLINIGKTSTTISGKFNSREIDITIPFTDNASIENAITCWCVLLSLHYENEVIKERMAALLPVNMRLELKRGINHCIIINDSYSADLSSFHIALNFLQQQAAGLKKTIILSDFFQTGLAKEELYGQITTAIEKHGINRLIGIGPEFATYLQSLDPKKFTFRFEYFNATRQFLDRFHSSDFKEEVILIKGARVFAFEQVARLLEQKAHRTVLEVNLTSITHNLKEIRKLLAPATRIMVMVKAFSYGSGSHEIAGHLEFNKVDYLAVAYIDEGVELREAGITLPIMVMNADEPGFEIMTDHNLEPEIYSFNILNSFLAFLNNAGIDNYPVHLKMDSGMHRLGFLPRDLNGLTGILKNNAAVEIKSVFSHLAASENPLLDEFTVRQKEIFEQFCRQLQGVLKINFLKHLANTSAIIRHPQFQYDMVRLGIGLYGVTEGSDAKPLSLNEVSTLKTTIAQVKQLKEGDTVGYNRKGIIPGERTIATVRIGYADGYPRNLSNGKGFMLVKNTPAPVIGMISMDMTMLDITGINDVREDDEVIVFGPGLSITQLAEWANTIPYEIMTGIGPRVKRVYFEE